MDRSEENLGQPGATWGNLKTEVAPLLVPHSQCFVKNWGNRGNLFESLTHARGEKSIYSLYRRSWQKVAPVAPDRCKWLGDSRLERGNLKNEVAPGCPRLPRWRVL
jgi:hypothetical protein